MKEANAKAEAPRKTIPFLMFLLRRILETKKYWLIPYWILLLTIGIILLLTGNSALLPAIYIAF
jgi:hypothetical protein